MKRGEGGTGRGRPRGFDRSTALAHAMEAFWEHGYEGTSVAALTEAMGINAPSLYAAFGGKEGLFREAIALYDETEGDATARALRDEPTARGAVEAMLRKNARIYSRKEKPTGCMIVLAAQNASPANRAVRDFLGEMRRDGVAAIRARLDRAKREGELPPSVDTRAVAAFYNAVLEGMSIEARDGASAKNLDRIVDCALAAWEPLTGRAQLHPRS